MFRQQGYTRYKKLGTRWRKPKGSQSKMRKCKKSHAKMPNIGFGSGKKETIPVIFNENDIGNNKKVIFGSFVGKKKRTALAEKYKDVEFVNMR